MSKKKAITAVKHANAKRANIPTAETSGKVRSSSIEQSAGISESSSNHVDVTGNAPVLFWRGKNTRQSVQNTMPVPIYVQEDVNPISIIESLNFDEPKKAREQPQMFENWFNEFDKLSSVEYYSHDNKKWRNRLIQGDSLTVMDSLSRLERLSGKVQCIYFDPPFGINYSSNWQPSTNRGNTSDQLPNKSSEPGVIKAFVDTWHDGVHSYLSYARDRLQAMRTLLTDTGSIFVQIGETNVHNMRCIMDEVFGPGNFVSQITFRTKSPLSKSNFPSVSNYLLWYAKDKVNMKYKHMYKTKSPDMDKGYTNVRDAVLNDRTMTPAEKKNPATVAPGSRIFTSGSLVAAGRTESCIYDFVLNGKTYSNGRSSWQTNYEGMQNLIMADRVLPGKTTPRYRRYFDDFKAMTIHNIWHEFTPEHAPIYVVQTSKEIIKRCILMTSDTGDLVLDPTCGSGTTAVVAEEWGRRWITIDTSKIAITLARSRLLGSSYPYYLLKDSTNGRKHLAKLGRSSASEIHSDVKTPKNDISRGFVCKQCPRVTISTITSNPQIKEIYKKWNDSLKSFCIRLSELVGHAYNDWEIPREAPSDWSVAAKEVHEKWWNARISMQKEIDASIASKADQIELLDQPYSDNKIVRMSGPFTVESTMPFRSLTTPDDSTGNTKQNGIIDARPLSEKNGESSFFEIIYDKLLHHGIFNTKKNEEIDFFSLQPHSGSECIQYVGKYFGKSGKEKNAAICIGPKFGTVDKSLIEKAMLEAGSDFDLLVCLGFAFDPHSDESLLGGTTIPTVRVRMHDDLYMAERIKRSKGHQLFVIVGEPELELMYLDNGNIQVRICGLDIFDPSTGQHRPCEPKEITCWMIDTNYSGDVFVPRHVYFYGNLPDPYKKLKQDLNSNISEQAWETVYSTISREFTKPESGMIAVKAINSNGDEVLKVCRV